MRISRSIGITSSMKIVVILWANFSVEDLAGRGGGGAQAHVGYPRHSRLPTKGRSFGLGPGHLTRDQRMSTGSQYGISHHMNTYVGALCELRLRKHELCQAVAPNGFWSGCSDPVRLFHEATSVQ